MMGGEPDAAASSISDDEPARVCAKNSYDATVV
jgi:hypothetical protein